MQQYLSKIYNRFFSSVELSGDSIQSCAPIGEHAVAYMEEGGLEPSFYADNRMVQSAKLPEEMKFNDLCTIQMPDRGGQNPQHMRRSRQVGDAYQLQRPGQSYGQQVSGQRAKQAWGSLNTRPKQSSNFTARYPEYPDMRASYGDFSGLDSSSRRPATAQGLAQRGGVTYLNEGMNVGQLSEGEVQSGVGGGLHDYPNSGGIKRERGKEDCQLKSFGDVDDVPTTKGVTELFDEKLRLDNYQEVAFSAAKTQPAGQNDFGGNFSPTKRRLRGWDEGVNDGSSGENHVGSPIKDTEGLKRGGQETGSQHLEEDSKDRSDDVPLTFAGNGGQPNVQRSFHRKRNRLAKKWASKADPSKPQVNQKKRGWEGLMDIGDFDNPPSASMDIPGAFQSKSVDLEDRKKQQGEECQNAVHRRQKSAATQTLDDVMEKDVKDVTPPTTTASRLRVEIGALPFQTPIDTPQTPRCNGWGNAHPHQVVRQSWDQGAAASSNFLTSPTKLDVSRRRHGSGRAVVEGTTYFQPVQPNSRENEAKEALSSEPLRARDPSRVPYSSAVQDFEDFTHDEPWDFEGAMYGVIDGTKIERRSCIGRGATSSVYHATYYSEGGAREVVLKCLMRECKGHDIQKEFRRESQILVKVPPHPNVVKMIGVVGSSMVLEFCNKGSLYNLLHDPSCQVTWGKVFDIALAVAQGMCHLHQYRIIHRDLKPGNLLMHEDDGEDIMKIADFGLSRNFLANSPMTAGLGTWQYSAPEVLREDKYSQKADVYSYGMVVWEACTRTEPYHGVPAPRAIAEIAQGDRPDMPASMPSTLRELVKSCLDQNPDARPSFKKIVRSLKSLKPSLDKVKEKTIPLPLGQ